MSPWDFGQARAACADATRAQAASERAYERAVRECAGKEQDYRKALATKILEAHADGIAWSVCADVARGDAKVAALRLERDIAVGVRDAMLHAVWRANNDRKDTQMLAHWSMRRELVESVPGPDPEWSHA